MTMQNRMMSLFSDHAGKQLASALQRMPSQQYFETKSWSLSSLLPRHYPNILTLCR
jgi:hypothetical protein